MIARWRLKESINRAKKRAPAWWYRPGEEKWAKKHRLMLRKTTKLCSCWMCSGHEKPLARDIRHGCMEQLKSEGA